MLLVSQINLLKATFIADEKEESVDDIMAQPNSQELIALLGILQHLPIFRKSESMEVQKSSRTDCSTFVKTTVD